MLVPGITGHSEFQDVGFPSSDVYLWYQSPTVPLCARLRVCNSLQVSLHSNSAAASLKVPSVADSRERHAHGMAMRWNRNQRKTSRRVVFGLRIKRLSSEFRASQELSSYVRGGLHLLHMTTDQAKPDCSTMVNPERPSVPPPRRIVDE